MSSSSVTGCFIAPHSAAWRQSKQRDSIGPAWKRIPYEAAHSRCFAGRETAFGIVLRKWVTSKTVYSAGLTPFSPLFVPDHANQLRSCRTKSAPGAVTNEFGLVFGGRVREARRQNAECRIRSGAA